MTIAISASGVVEVSGACPVEDAEVLLRHLLSTPNAAVDWRACESAHTAVIQLLLAANVAPLGPPASEFLEVHIAPLFARASP